MNRGDLTVLHALFGALVAVGLITAILFELRLNDLSLAVAAHEHRLEKVEQAPGEIQ
jgi:hypothetical protein